MAGKIISSVFFTVAPILVSVFCYGIFAPICLAVAFYRRIVIKIAKFLRPDLDAIVSGYDSFFTAEKPGEAICNIVICFLVDGKISAPRIRELFQERVFHLKNQEDELIFRRLSQFWTSFLGYGFWKTEVEFQIENHVRDYDYNHILQLANKPSDEKSLHKIFPALAKAPWNPKRSPWEVVVVSDFTSNKTEGSKASKENSLVIFRFDHLLCDVYSIIGLLRVLFQSPFATPMISRNNRALSRWEKLRALLTMPYEMATPLPVLLKGRFLGARKASVKDVSDSSQPFSIGLVKEMKKKFNVEFATILHSAVLAAICRVVESAGTEAPAIIDLGTIVPLPDHPEGLCNHWISFLTEYPCKSPSSADRLYRAQIVIKKFETNLFAVAMSYYLRIMSILPIRIVRNLCASMYARGPSCAMSNFPTSTSREFIDGAEIIDLYTTASFTTGMGLAITSWGVNNKQRINFMVNGNILDSLIPSDSFSTFFMEELEKLQAFGSHERKKEV